VLSAEAIEMVRTQVQITQKQAASLKKRAAEEDVSQSEIVRRSIELYLRNSGTVADQERRERALRVLGRFRSGKRDVGERHDKYLAEVYGK
jgi:hypothetical protein